MQLLYLQPEDNSLVTGAVQGHRPETSGSTHLKLVLVARVRKGAAAVIQWPAVTTWGQEKACFMYMLSFRHIAKPKSDRVTTPASAEGTVRLRSSRAGGLISALISCM